MSSSRRMEPSSPILSSTSSSRPSFARRVGVDEWQDVGGASRADDEYHSYPNRPDGTTIYITRDIGAASERYAEYKFDKMVYVVASQQNLHLAQFFKVLELMGFDWAKDGRLEHINFGMGATRSLSPPFFMLFAL